MIYLFRTWPDISKQAIYSFNNQSLAFSLHKDPLSATVVHAHAQSGLSVGQTLTYEELVRVLVKDRQIMTL